MPRRWSADYQKNADADGIDATPTFIIDGEKVGNMPYEEFEAKLERRARGLRSGASASRVREERGVPVVAAVELVAMISAAMREKVMPLPP